MNLIPLTPDIAAYLQASEIINWQHPDIIDLARVLSAEQPSDSAIAKRCFEWVRDNIKHSWDYQLNPVTYVASDVLYYKTGYCYAKAHLLAALLRANNIPAGLCYQRLSIKDNGAPYCLHGLNAVYLQNHGWYRIDPRGNKKGVDAQFNPPREQLAFKTLDKRETDLTKIWTDPLPIVLKTLKDNSTYLQVYLNLPDLMSWDRKNQKVK